MLAGRGTWRRWIVVLGLALAGPTGAVGASVAAPAGLQILTADEPPSNYLDGSQLTGFSTDLVLEIKRRLRIQEAITVEPWARLYETALANPNVVVLGMAKTQERLDRGFSFIGPIGTSHSIVFKKTGSPVEVRSVDDIRKQGLTVGGIRGDWRSNYFRDQGIKTTEVVFNDIVIKMLVADRFELCVLSDFGLGINLRKAGLPVAAITPMFELQTGRVYLAFSRGTSPATIARWQAALKDIQNSPGFVRRMTAKWSTILGVPVGFNAENGFYAK